MYPAEVPAGALFEHPSGASALTAVGKGGYLGFRA